MSAQDSFKAPDDDGVGGVVTKFEELPANHVFQLVHDGNWEAVLQRLKTQHGRMEAQQWVTSSGCTMLLLHMLCSQREIHEHDAFMQALQEAVDLFPNAVRSTDSRGNYPLHCICMQRDWNDTTIDSFKLLLSAYPSAVFQNITCYSQNGIRLSDTTVLHQLLCCFGFTYESKLECVRFLLDLCPAAVRMVDGENWYPLHRVCEYWITPNKEVVKLLLKKFPQALEKRAEDLLFMNDGLRTPLVLNAQTPLLLSLRARVSDYSIARLLLEACPWAARLADHDNRVLHYSEARGQLGGTGDALDYISTQYSNAAGADWIHEYATIQGFRVADLPFELEEGHGDAVHDYKGYIDANLNFLNGSNRRRENRLGMDQSFDMFLTILQVLYGKPTFLPLHASVQGLLCRPWNLVVMDKLLERFAEETAKVDPNGNLPLHLFLESCMVERERAIKKGYAIDNQDYQKAVERCAHMLLEANRDAAGVANGEGRLALALAIENCGCYDTVIFELLDAAPKALVTRDIKTRLSPFATAAVGADSDLNLVYSLLRYEPRALTTPLGFS